MKKSFSLILFLSISICFYAQKQIEIGLFLHSISNNNDTIDFIVCRSQETTPKPTILFCQGSSPTPLIVDFGEQLFIPSLNNFDYREISKEYNIVVISMPHIPPIAQFEQLNRSLQYVSDLSDEHSFDLRYLRDNYLEKYIERAESVLLNIKNESWVNADKIAVIGHSQGSYIALKLAQKNDFIHSVGYFSGNPSGRYTTKIRNERRMANAKQTTQEEAQENIHQLYEEWKLFTRNEIPNGYMGDPPCTWTSFTLPLWESLIKLKTPLFITYGTMDTNSSESCELLPIYFEKYGKTNYKILPFVGCGHNFEEIDEDGQPNFNKMHWDSAVNEFIIWWESF